MKGIRINDGILGGIVTVNSSKFAEMIKVPHDEVKTVIKRTKKIKTFEEEFPYYDKKTDDYELSGYYLKFLACHFDLEFQSDLLRYYDSTTVGISYLQEAETGIKSKLHEIFKKLT